jgi:hypothetical protein
VFKLTLTVGGDLLDIQGDDVTIETAFPVIKEWIDALPRPEAPVQAAIDHLTARLAAANLKLLHDVGAATPPT